MSSLIEALRIAKHGEAWRSGHLSFLLSHRFGTDRNRFRATTDDDHLREAVAWLERAQDATPDGGFVGRYRLDRGWTSSYPETTGYIVPTMLRLARETGETRYRERAEKAIEFLLELQLENGAFPGAEVAENADNPSPFNTGQILHGLTAWHKETGCERTLAAAKRAADWLCSVQDSDGAFRKHFYYDVATAYAAHLTCWLAEFGEHTGDENALKCVGRHLDWVLTQFVSETGWFDRAGFDRQQLDDREAFTHTIAYTIWGVLYSAEVLGREDGIAAARKAAYGVLRRLELSKRLPGVLNWEWKSRADFCCLTGNAQMALIWFRLFDRDGDPRLLNGAFKAIDEIELRQSLDQKNPALRGGIPGSFPVWGGYIRMGVPNWAAKYFVDSLLEKRRILAELQTDAGRAKVRSDWSVPGALPRRVSENSNPTKSPPKVAMLSAPRSRKLARILAETDQFGFTPSLVLLEEPPVASGKQRLFELITKQGLRGLLSKFKLCKPPAVMDRVVPPKATLGSGAKDLRGAEEECRTRRLESVTVERCDSGEALAAMRAHGIELCIHAGAGILRQPVLDAPALGPLNAHMGLLPKQRGMNVTEWAAFRGEPIGTTVHLVDRGIDTGDVLCVREVDTSSARNSQDLRHLVDDVQIALLSEVLRSIVDSGQIPERHAQGGEDGQQEFAMHPELRMILDAWLESGCKASSPAAEPVLGR
ncbi:MAG: formyltransferase family protein [Planctomycetota bacterium]